MSTFLLIFMKGLIIGLAIAAPVGPIGVLCIQRSLQEGFKLGFISGMGAATADGIYGVIQIIQSRVLKKSLTRLLGPESVVATHSKCLQLAQARLSFWPQKMGEKIENKLE